MNSLETLEDEKLMLEYQADNYSAFEVLYRRHKSLVYSYIYKRLKNKDQVEEVFQNIFLKFHRSRELYDPKYKFLQWLYTLARSELYDFCKKKRLVTISFDEEVFKVEEEFEIEDVDLSTLKEKERLAIELRYFEEQEYEEIAKLLQTSQSNARKIVSRAILKLKTKLLGATNE